MEINYTPLFLSLKLALLCTIILTFLGIPISYWLSTSNSFLKMSIRSTLLLPLVIPPSVLGFYFLILFSPASPVGNFIENIFHFRLVFTFQGLVVASVVASAPFMINPIIAGFESLPSSLREASFSLGKNEFQTLFHVLIPSIRPSLLIGIIMTFIHTFGEFGLVLMIGGKIPGKTLTASIALYDHVESLEYVLAHHYAAVITFSAFLSLLLLFVLNRKIPFNYDYY